MKHIKKLVGQVHTERGIVSRTPTTNTDQMIRDLDQAIQEVLPELEREFEETAILKGVGLLQFFPEEDGGWGAYTVFAVEGKRAQLCIWWYIEDGSGTPNPCKPYWTTDTNEVQYDDTKSLEKIEAYEGEGIIALPEED